MESSKLVDPQVEWKIIEELLQKEQELSIAQCQRVRQLRVILDKSIASRCCDGYRIHYAADSRQKPRSTKCDKRVPIEGETALQWGAPVTKPNFFCSEHCRAEFIVYNT